MTDAERRLRGLVNGTRLPPVSLDVLRGYICVVLDELDAERREVERLKAALETEQILSASRLSTLRGGLKALVERWNVFLSMRHAANELAALLAAEGGQITMRHGIFDPAGCSFCLRAEAENERLRQQLVEAQRQFEDERGNALIGVQNEIDSTMRAREAERQLAALRAGLRALVELLDGHTEPLHPASWIVELTHAKALLAEPKAQRPTQWEALPLRSVEQMTIHTGCETETNRQAEMERCRRGYQFDAREARWGRAERKAGQK